MIGDVATADPSHRLEDTARRLARALRNPTASGRTIAGRLARMPTAERRVRELTNENHHLRELYEAWVPSGHFYSPFPDLDDYGRRVAELRDPERPLAGIDLREDEQLALLEVLADLLAAEGPDGGLAEHEDRRGDRRYWLDNPAYAHGDGTVLHAMLRHVRPRRIVEVGSGYSSALILDTVDNVLPDTTVTFVEPFPALVESLLRADDERRVTIHRTPVQDVDPAVFDALEAGDVLFIDSTHVVKAGSDVNHLFFDVLPRLRVGVWVHLHDIFFPFEYPEAWVREGRAWHEAHLLRVNIARLRAKVEPDAGSPKYITTRPGIGYTLNKLGVTVS